jgi:hypothetical protein
VQSVFVLQPACSSLLENRQAVKQNVEAAYTASTVF